jgi:hypothetical protein
MNRRCASRLPPPAATLWATSESVGCWPALIWYIYTDLECAQSRRAPHAATSPEERDNASTPKMTPSARRRQRHGDGVTPPGRAHTHRDTRGRASVCEPSRLRAGVSGVAVCPVTPCACARVWLYIDYSGFVCVYFVCGRLRFVNVSLRSPVCALRGTHGTTNGRPSHTPSLVE